MALSVLYFAAAREAAGTDRETLEVQAASVGELRRALAERHPALGRILSRCRLAVDQEFVDDAHAVPDGSEVAVIPPVAGGAPAIRLVDRPLALEEAVSAVAGPGRGGIATFTGTVRGETRGKRVLHLEYEAYRPMAERTLADIGRDLERDHGVTVSILHRLGRLLPGEAAVVVACAAEHRAPAFRACQEAIDRLKREAPIWKREVYEDGSEWVGLGP